MRYMLAGCIGLGLLSAFLVGCNDIASKASTVAGPGAPTGPHSEPVAGQKPTPEQIESIRRAHTPPSMR